MLNESGEIRGALNMPDINKIKQFLSYGKRKYLGTYKSLDQAIKVRKQANKKYGYSQTHGEDYA